jgi:hypothetical protein
MAIKSYSNINFSIRSKKRFIQTFFYRSSKVKQSSVLMLCGPDIINHYNDYKIIKNSNTNSRLYIAEIDTKIYNQNIKDLNNIKNLKYNIINDDIINCTARRFVDLDFCKLLNTTLPIVNTMYNKMLNIKTTLNKHILITFAINRNANGTDTTSFQDNINSLCVLFNISNEFIKLDLLPNSNIMKHKTADCMYSTYRDGAPMCTFSYQW